jgi:hypothetical protein
MPALWGLLVLCALAFAATFWWPGGFAGTWLAGPDGVLTSPLPEASAPAERYSRESGLIAHRDFELLADPPGEAASADLEFHSWLAARDAGTIPADAPAVPLETAPPASAPATAAPGLETDTQEGE